MARKALTDEQKIKYISDNAEIFCERSKKNAEKINGYENLKGEELHKIYTVVQGSIRRSNTTANNASPNTDAIDITVFGQIKEMIKKSNNTEEVIEYQSQLEDLVALCVERLEKIMQNDIAAKEDLEKDLIEQLNKLGKKYKLVEEE